MNLLDATLAAGVDVGNVSAWCRAHGVRRATFYRHQAAFAAGGVDGLVPKSRAPKSSPTATPAPLVQAVVALRAELAPDNGAAAIQARMLAQQGEGEGTADWAEQAVREGWAVPSVRTINRILSRAGLVTVSPAKRPRSSWRRFTYARPRDCWQLDGTHHTLADGSTVVAMDLEDDCSRVWLASLVAVTETTDAAIATLTAAVTEYGAPAIVLTDNGKAFTGGARGPFPAPGRFGLAVAATGARLIHSSPYHPQTLGKCERLHQTSKGLLAAFYDQPAATAAELQQRLDRVRGYYNQDRHHTAVRTTPQKVWDQAIAEAALGGPGQLPVYPDAVVSTVRCDERARFRLGKITRIALDRDHAGLHVTAILHGTTVTVYNPDGQPIAHGPLDRSKTYQHLPAVA